MPNHPDRLRTGTFPDSWVATHRTANPGVITAASAVVRTLAHYGFGWGAAFGDLQHFDPTI